MFKFFNNYKKDITRKTLTAFVLIIFVTSLILIVGTTYASDSFTVVFNRAEGNEVLKTCHTDANGKLDQECIDTITGYCSKWSPDKYFGTPQSNQIAVSEFLDMSFTDNTNYYCVGGSSSSSYSKGCYVCKTDDTIMHWSSNGNANDSCPAGYNKSTTILNEEDCVTVVPESCYVCKDDNNIMKWDNNGDSDSNCSSGYTPIEKEISECKTIIPDSCYVCNSNNNVMKWDNNGNGDSNCSSGYTAANIPQEECATIENPPTGDILIFVVWVIGLGAICYSVYYYRKLNAKN